MAVLYKTRKYLLEGKPKVPPMQHSAPPTGMPIYDCYKFILGRIQRGEVIKAAPQPRTINWIVPDLGAPGAGGHLDIFRCVKFLEDRGYHNRIYFFNVMGGDTRGPVKNIYERHYKNVAGDKAEIFSAHFDDIQPAEAVLYLPPPGRLPILSAAWTTASASSTLCRILSPCSSPAAVSIISLRKPTGGASLALRHLPG